MKSKHKILLEEFDILFSATNNISVSLHPDKYQKFYNEWSEIQGKIHDFEQRILNKVKIKK